MDEDQKHQLFKSVFEAALTMVLAYPERYEEDLYDAIEDGANLVLWTAQKSDELVQELDDEDEE